MGLVLQPGARMTIGRGRPVPSRQDKESDAARLGDHPRIQPIHLHSGRQSHPLWSSPSKTGSSSVVDDGSTQPLPDLTFPASSLGDRNFQVLRKPDGGAASARNLGMDKARGEFVAFLDADDLWESTKLALQVAVMDAHPQLRLCTSQFAFINESGAVTGKRLRCVQCCAHGSPSRLATGSLLTACSSATARSDSAPISPRPRISELWIPAGSEYEEDAQASLLSRPPWRSLLPPTAPKT